MTFRRRLLPLLLVVFAAAALPAYALAQSKSSQRRAARHHRQLRRAGKLRATIATAATKTSPGTLVWSDEFTGPAGAAPSAAKWKHDVGYWGAGNKELEYYTDGTGNAALDGSGHLAITARRQTVTDPATGATYNYTSARLETQGLFSAKYGTFAVRMKIPAGQGLWPAFWMLGDNINTVGWPACGEIDVMEALGNDPFTVYGTIHGPDGSASGYHWQSKAVSPTSLASAFHTYAVKWTSSSITWMLDGTPYATVTPADLAPGQSWSSFQQPFHMVLNLAVGGTWPGYPNASTPFPSTLFVDWVRVYK